MGRRAIAVRVAIAAIAIAVCWAAYATLRSRYGLTSQAQAHAGSTALASAKRYDQELRRLVLGVWHDHYKSERTMTLKEDGTGTMLVKLSGVSAALMAPRLWFDLQWSLENAHLIEHSLGGEPATAVQMILKMMGDRVDQPILELTADQLLLLDQDGKTKYDWRRRP